MNIGNDLHKFWRYLSVAATVAILLGAGVFVFESLPPHTIVMATGAEVAPTTNWVSATVKSWPEQVSSCSYSRQPAVSKI
jgi:hypothetical protein